MRTDPSAGCGTTRGRQHNCARSKQSIAVPEQITSHSSSDSAAHASAARGTNAGSRAMTLMDQYIIPVASAEAAPGVEQVDVKPVNRKQDRALYAGREKIYPKLAHGRFRAAK